MRINRFIVAAVLVIIVFINPLRSQDPGSGSLVSKPIVQPQGWHLNDFAINNRKSVLLGGSGGTQADGLVLISPSQYLKFVSFGDPVPGVFGNYFWGFPTFKLNDRDEAAFKATYGPCGDWYHCEQSQGIFTHDRNGIKKVVSSGDPVPGMNSLIFWGFGQIWFNSNRMILFQGFVGTPMPPSGVVDISKSLFLYDGKSIKPIGDNVSNSEAIPLAFGDDGSVYLSTLGGAVFKYFQGQNEKLIASGDSLPGYGMISNIRDIAASKSGNIVFRAQFGDIANQGLFLLSRTGTLTRIIYNGDPTPAGGYYRFWYTTQTRSGLTSSSTSFKPVVNDAGIVLFSAPIEGGVKGALFLFRDGAVIKVLADGDSAPGHESTPISITGPGEGNKLFSIGADYILNAQDMAALYVEGNGIFLFTEETDVFANPFIRQISPKATHGFLNGEVLQLNDYGDVLFNTDTGLFMASLDSSIVPNGNFENPGQANLPANWEITWSEGRGSVLRLESGPEYAYSGSCILRLQVAPGAGYEFALSDQFDVLPNRDYRVSSQLRHYLEGSEAFFSVLQFDSSGNLSGFSETSAHVGESEWNWQLESVHIHTAPNTAYIRIRFGLLAQDSYLDIDDVRIAALP